MANNVVKELTPRQICERAIYESEKAAQRLAKRPMSVRDSLREQAKRPRETAADRRNFYRNQAGWPLLKEKNNA